MMAVHAYNIEGCAVRWPIFDDSTFTVKGSISGSKVVSISIVVVEIDGKEVSGVMVR